MGCWQNGKKSSTRLSSSSLTIRYSFRVSRADLSILLVDEHTTRNSSVSSAFSAPTIPLTVARSPPKKPMKDDVTGEPLIQRSDDNVETLRKRLSTFHSQTGPVVEYYKSKGLWHGIDATQSPSVIWDNLRKVFEVKK